LVLDEYLAGMCGAERVTVRCEFCTFFVVA
jgi:hypothetical protein